MKIINTCRYKINFKREIINYEKSQNQRREKPKAKFFLQKKNFLQPNTWTLILIEILQINRMIARVSQREKRRKREENSSEERGSIFLITIQFYQIHDIKGKRLRIKLKSS